MSEVWLPNGASACITAARNDEEVVYSTIRGAAERAIRIQKEFESCLAHRAVRGYEGWKGILASLASEVVYESFRIWPQVRKSAGTRTRATDGGLGVAACALVGVETRAKASVVGLAAHNFNGSETG